MTSCNQSTFLREEERTGGRGCLGSIMQVTNVRLELLPSARFPWQPGLQKCMISGENTYQQGVGHLVLENHCPRLSSREVGQQFRSYLSTAAKPGSCNYSSGSVPLAKAWQSGRGMRKGTGNEEGRSGVATNCLILAVRQDQVKQSGYLRSKKRQHPGCWKYSKTW